MPKIKAVGRLGTPGRISPDSDSRFVGAGREKNNGAPKPQERIAFEAGLQDSRTETTILALSFANRWRAEELPQNLEEALHLGTPLELIAQYNARRLRRPFGIDCRIPLKTRPMAEERRTRSGKVEGRGRRRTPATERSSPYTIQPARKIRRVLRAVY